MKYTPRVKMRKLRDSVILNQDTLSKQLADDGPEGRIEAIVSVFNNVDRAGDVIMPGAFTETLKRRKPKGVWFHQWSVPIAKTDKAEELLPGDERLPKGLKKLGGLLVEGSFNMGTQRGSEAFSDIAFGILDEFSIGFFVDEAIFKPKEDIWQLTKLELFEWSPVLAGMNEKTALIDVKQFDNDYFTSYREYSQASVPFVDQLDAAQAAVSECITRAREVKTLRQSEGRELGQDRTLQLTSLRDAIDKLISCTNRANTIDPEEVRLRSLAINDLARRAELGLPLGE